MNNLPSPAYLKLMELYGHVKVRGRAVGHQAGYLAILRWLQPDFSHIVHLQFDNPGQLTLSYHRQKLLELEPNLKTIETALKYLQPHVMRVIKISRGVDYWKVWSFTENKSVNKSIVTDQSESAADMWRIEPEPINDLADKPSKRERPATEPSYIYYYHPTGNSVKKRVKTIVDQTFEQPEQAIAESCVSKTESTDGTSIDIMINDIEGYQLDLDLDFAFL